MNTDLNNVGCITFLWVAVQDERGVGHIVRTNAELEQMPSNLLGTLATILTQQLARRHGVEGALELIQKHLRICNQEHPS